LVDLSELYDDARTYQRQLAHQIQQPLFHSRIFHLTFLNAGVINGFNTEYQYS
jgi:hypothetical protein